MVCALRVAGRLRASNRIPGVAFVGGSTNETRPATEAMCAVLVVDIPAGKAGAHDVRAKMKSAQRFAAFGRGLVPTCPVWVRADSWGALYRVHFTV